MSKNVLLVYLTTGGKSFYYDFAEEFLLNGNKVMHWNIYNHDFLEGSKEKILDKITKFKPDFIISFNNICPEDVIKKFPIPVLLLDSDNPEFFHNKDIIGKYDGLFYLGFQSASKELYQNILKADITEKNFLFFPTATNFRKDTTKTANTNISFIGSNFYRDFLKESERILIPQEIDTVLYLTDKVKKNYFFDDQNITDKSLINFTKYYLAGQYRLKYLSAISDLGLQIYSDSNWKNLFYYDLELSKCYNSKIVFTKEENQDIYNSSKIAINLSHLQATSSFSFRVPDIMATNACLVMEEKIDWHKIYGPYVSNEVKKAIIYKDQYDMREKCINLLKDEELRLRCVDECQKAIEINGRWHSRIRSLENFLGMKLLNNSLPQLRDYKSLELHLVIEKDEKEEEKYEKAEKKKEEKVDPKIQPQPQNFPKKKLKSNLYMMLKSLVILIYLIPFFGKKLIKERRVNKIINQLSDKLYINN